VTETSARRYARFISDNDQTAKAFDGAIEQKEKRPRTAAAPFCPWVRITTNGDDAASQSGGPDPNRNGGRDRRNGPNHAHGRP